LLQFCTTQLNYGRRREDGRFALVSREDIKQQVRTGRLRLVLGTDAASGGLNLQRLATLINLDLPWNPTPLEQRKGRIQRIGQLTVCHACHMEVDLFCEVNGNSATRRATKAVHHSVTNNEHTDKRSGLEINRPASP
jgi:superfamily II DNA/RNA helicase